MTKLVSSENLLQAIGKRIVLKPAAFTELINCWVINGLPQAVSLPIASNELPAFQPTPISLVSCTEVKPPALLELPAIELDERKLLDEERMEEDIATDDDERTVDTEERIDDNEDERIDDDGERTDDDNADETLDLLVDTDDVLPPQIAPVTVGVSTVPFALTCKPNATVCPGWILLFQLKLEAL